MTNNIQGVKYNPERVSRSPLNTILPVSGFITFARLRVKVTSSPVSHSCPTDKRDMYDRLGYLWATLALSGKSG